MGEGGWMYNRRKTDVLYNISFNAKEEEEGKRERDRKIFLPLHFFFSIEQ